MIDQILELRKSGHSIRKIACALGVSRNSVRRYIRTGSSDGTEQNSPPVQKLSWALRMNWIELATKRKKGVSVKQLYDDYQPPVDYSVFARHLRKHAKPTSRPAIPIDHTPAERCQIDYADGIKLVDVKTGKLIKTQLFCGVLPFSSYTFAEFTMNQQLESFIRSQERMWAYFGGVTPYVVIDNLKSGVKKAHRYDPELNPTYCDFANHSGFAVLPARPRTPRDKASVESAIGAIQRSFYQQYREHKFYSLAELNEEFRRFLDEFNAKLMPDHGVSRRDRFEVEREKLQPLASSSYSLAIWKEAKVHPDCCIQVDKAFYSVPFRYQGQSVRVKISENTVEVYDTEAKSIACHKKAASYKRSIVEEHLPPTKLQASSYQVHKAKYDAKAIGPKLSELVDHLLSGDKPFTYLRRVQGIIRLKNEDIPNESLEYAAANAFTFQKFTLSYIKSCARNHQGGGGHLSIIRVPKRDLETIHLHGD